MTSSEVTCSRASCGDIYRGEPAGRFLWDLEGLNPSVPPTGDRFYTANGVRFFRSSSYEHMRCRQKDRPQTWYTVSFGQTEYTESEDGESDVFCWQTPVGRAVGRRHLNHFTEFPVKSISDLRTWTFVHQDMAFEPNTAWLRRYDHAAVAGAGERGLQSPTASRLPQFGVNWSPVQQLLQFDTGIETFYYLLMDAPQEMAELLTVMQARCLERLELGLCLFPNAASVYWGENTSSSVISPRYYRDLTLPHIRTYAQMVHSHGMRLIVHMCGLLKGLMDCFVETGMDGIHSATPPPIGDASYALIRGRFGPTFTIIGRLNAELWVGRSKEQIQAVLHEQIAPDLLNSPFSLLVTTDAIPDISYDNVMVLWDALEGMTW